MSGLPTDRHSGVWVIVPVYNEASVVADVVRGLLTVFEHVVCVDDGSSDDSAQQLRRTGAVLIRHPINLGQGAAIQTGVEYSRRQPSSRAFVTFDADGQHRVVDVLSMLDRLVAGDADIVLGTRFAEDTSRVPWLKKVVLRTAARVSPTGRRLGLTDAHNGLRVFSRRVADVLNLESSGMAHASEFVRLIDRHKWNVVEVPVHIVYSQYSLAKGQPLLNGVNILFDSAVRRHR